MQIPLHVHDTRASPHWRGRLYGTRFAASTLLLLLLLAWTVGSSVRAPSLGRGLLGCNQLARFKPLALLDLEGEVKGADGEVDSLREHSTHGAAKIKGSFFYDVLKSRGMSWQVPQ